jgi:SET domain-containing protein
VQPDAACFSVGPSPIHGLGAFAVGTIAKGSRVVEYCGEKISKAESVRRCAQNNWFIFYFDEQFNLDGNVPWNPARYINHSCAPNCDAELIDGQIWIVAHRDISASEEITFDYGYGPGELEEHPCHCGAENCVGYIVAAEFRDAALRRSS